MCGAFLNAAMAVATGQADYVVVHKVMTMEGDNRYGQAFGQMGQVRHPAMGGPMAFAVPYGLQSPGQMFALAARRHMHRYGTTTEQFAEVTINARSMAANNPEARFRDADHGGGPPREPDDRGPAAALRLLHGDRLRLRGRRSPRPNGPRTCARPPAYIAGRGGGGAATATATR